MRAAHATRREAHLLPALVGLPLLGGPAGCAIGVSGGPIAEEAGRVYYLDGAGGGGLVSWGRGVSRGLALAGAGLAFEEYVWQTGFGAGVDQVTSAAYKRGQAAKLAGRIRRWREAHPDGPIHLVGFSAGTAVALYTLEALPEDCPVESVVLLASSVSADSDLTPALQRVRRRAVVFCSEKDAILNWLVPVTGTADRKGGLTAVAGVRGFRLPPSPDTETRRQYRKLQTIAWNAGFATLGNHGGHSDFVEPRFVQAMLAPLLAAEPPTLLAQGSDPRGGGLDERMVGDVP